MGREVFTYTEIDSNDFQRVNQTSLTVQFFHTATYATATQDSTTISLAEQGGLEDGNGIYVQMSSSVKDTTISSGIGATENLGAGNVVLAAQTSSINNGGVVLHTKSVALDQAATWYDDPDFETGVKTAITLDSNNEAEVFLKPGAYGVVFKSGSTVVRVDYHEVVEELDWVTVTPQHISNTAGIGEAIRRLNSTTGGVVYIPPGTYNITKEIQFLQNDGSTAASNIHIKGAGPGLTILKVPNGTGNIGSGATSGIFDLATVNNVTISDMTINGNQADATNGADVSGAEDYEGIKSAGSDDITIRNVVITQTRKGIYATTGTSNRWLIEDCYINDVGAEGILLEDMNKCQIVDNKVVTTGNDGISVAGAGNANDDIVITGNYVNKSGTPTNIENAGNQQGAAVKVRNSNNVVVSSNVLISTLDVVGLTNGIETDPADTNHCVFANNIVRDTELAGILVANNCVVTGNYIFNAGEDGIMMLPSASTALENVTITNNSINDCNETTDTGDDIAGIHIDCSDHTTYAATIKHLVITGNTTFDSRGTVRMDYNIIIAAKAGVLSITKATITGNDFSGATDKKSVLWTAVDVTSVPEIMWRNNTMSNAADDEYYGVATLSSGTFAIVNAQWPGHTGNRFNISRTDANSSTLTGALEGLYANGTTKLTITSRGSAINTIQRAEDIALSLDQEDKPLYINIGGGEAGTDPLLAPITGTVSNLFIQVATIGGNAGDSMDHLLVDEDSVELSVAQTIRGDGDNTIYTISGSGNATTIGKALELRSQDEVGTTIGASTVKVWIHWGSASVEVNDVSKVYWEYVGTPPATA